MTNEGLKAVPDTPDGQLLGQTGLAHSRLTPDNHEGSGPGLRLGNERSQLRPLRFPAHEWRPVGKRGAGLGGPRRLVDDTVEMPAIGKALQAVAAPVGESELRPGTGQLSDNLRDEDLTSLGPAGDARRGVDRLAVHVVAFHHDFAGVDSDSDTDLVSRRFRVAILQALLDRDGARQRPAHRRERDHETVAQGLHFPTFLGPDAAAHDLLVGAQDAMGDRVSPAGAQIGGALDVTEEDRHRTFGEPLDHGRPP